MYWLDGDMKHCDCDLTSLGGNDGHLIMLNHLASTGTMKTILHKLNRSCDLNDLCTVCTLRNLIVLAQNCRDYCRGMRPFRIHLLNIWVTLLRLPRHDRQVAIKITIIFHLGELEENSHILPSVAFAVVKGVSCIKQIRPRLIIAPSLPPLSEASLPSRTQNPHAI